MGKIARLLVRLVADRRERQDRKVFFDVLMNPPLHALS